MLGIIENMSGYLCPHCQDCTSLFAKGGGASLAEYEGLPFLGFLPIDIQFGRAMENMQEHSFPLLFKESTLFSLFKDILVKVVANK